jgi:hypothetical protein
MLRQQELTTLRPFDFIRCPVCGGDSFTEIVPAGSVWCDECNARFTCRTTCGDPGCVVDCHLEALEDPYRLIMFAKGFMMQHACPAVADVQPRAYFYAVLKHCDLDPDNLARGVAWILSALAMTPEHQLYGDEDKRAHYWEYKAPPFVSAFEVRVGKALPQFSYFQRFDERAREYHQACKEQDEREHNAHHDEIEERLGRKEQ